ncbi:hypothetical protein K461DRAFT_280321 [Myriangium duriaei CBS 260.36]|uniref:Zn(2)-C6 fungal-type domain-containing protein n=1 Tax=Myriangium duriaei CBS 260.36 TaxID=1168546 RepID=A0A9P4MEL9_9PEZI|nr:hypothetical protein K461DRAFT_280321 [Myriangium duriaei CBS 260.36]
MPALMAPRQTQSTASAVACLACRERHSRCDAVQPKCARCVRNRRECIYVASRRGCKASSRQDSSPDSTHSSRTDITTSTPPTSVHSEHASVRDQHTTAIPADQHRHVDLYYQYFHKTHPFLLPQHFLHLQPWSVLLQQVVSHIGSKYCGHAHHFDFESFVDSYVEVCTDKSIDMVQVRLLSAILLHTLVRPDSAVIQLNKAVDLALELGLHNEWFAVQQGMLHPLRAESTRRTWWELYVIDGYFAGFHHRPSFRCKESLADTLLPGEEQEYEHGRSSQTCLSYHHLRRRVFLDDQTFSSFALRIEAAGILGRVLAANDPMSFVSIESNLGLDGLLSTWLSDLPASKPVVSTGGKCDELVFQAQMIVLMASIYLHLPRSGIFNFVNSSDVACAKANQIATPFLDPNLHASRAMDAAKSLTILALSDLHGHHTPFFTCGLVLVAIVHLSAMAALFDEPPECQVDRLRQVFALLRSVAKTWPLAENAVTQLKKIAAAASSLNPASQPHSDMWTGREDFEALMSYMWWFDGRCCQWQPPAQLEQDFYTTL